MMMGRVVLALGLGIGVFFGTPLEAQEPEPRTTGFVVDGLAIVGGEIHVLALLVTPFIQDLVLGGPDRALLEIRELDDPAAQNDRVIEVASYRGIDQDGNPADDLSGEEPFLVTTDSLTPDGSPLVLFTPGVLTDGHLSAGPATLQLGGGFSFADVTISGQVLPDAISFISDPMTAAIPAVIFEAIPAPPPFQGSLLEALLFFGAEPDVDLDGDGAPDSFSIVLALSAIACVIEKPELDASFLRGDCDADGAFTLPDATYLLVSLFLGGAFPPCASACDFDDSGTIDLADPLGFLGFLFLGGPPPPEPASKCGPDPTDDPLTCTSFTGC